MKAAVMWEVGKPLRVQEVPVPEIGDDEVLVETRTCGICGTDLHILSGHGYVPKLPHILGHEPAGVVAKVGSKVTGLTPGTRVVPHLFVSCEACFYCRTGRQQQCLNLSGILGVLVPGAFAQFFKIPAANLFNLPDNVPFDVGGLISDAVVTSVRAYKRANLHLDDAALVFGTGGLGLILVQILRAAGMRVLALDRSEDSLRLAKELGADLALKAGNPETNSAIKEFTAGFGVQCVFNCVGTAQSMRDSAAYVMRCGRIVVIGEEPEYPAIDTTEIAQRELEIVGSRNGTQQDMAEAIRLVASGVVKPPITHRFPLEEINAAFDCLRRGATGRVVITIKP